MHSSRIATFLLGAWIAGSLFMAVLALENVRLAGRVSSGPIPAAAEVINKAGPEQAWLLLRHFAWEQNRFYFTNWELLQIPVALFLMAFLYFAMDKRLLPPILCGLMLVLVLFEYWITPEFTYRGREADFPPGNQAFGAEARVWLLTELLIGIEGVKLLIGGILTSYLFVHRSRRRAHNSGDPAETVGLSPLRG